MNARGLIKELLGARGILFTIRNELRELLKLNIVRFTHYNGIWDPGGLAHGLQASPKP